MSEKKSSMARDAFLFLPAKLLEGILLMLVTSLYSAIFTEEVVGTFRIVNTTVLSSYLVSLAFMANAIARYIGEEHSKDNGKTFYSTVMTVYLTVTALVFVVCFALYFAFDETAYIFGAFMFASYALFQLLNAALIQLAKIRASVFFSILSATLKLLIAYLLVFGHGEAFSNPYPAFIANIVADGIAGVCAVFVLKIPFSFSFNAFSPQILKTILKFGIPLMGVSLNVAILNFADTYLVEFFHGTAAVAVYGQNYTIASSVFTMINIAVMRAVYPNLLRQYREGGIIQAMPHLNAGVRLYMLIAFPAACGLFGISLSLSKLMFVVDSYHYGAPVIGLTAVAMVFMGLTEYSNKAYELTSNTRPVFQNSLVSAVLKILLSVILLSAFSYIFSAVGTVIAFLIYFLLTSYRAKKIFLFKVPTKTVLKILISAILCGVCAYFVTLLPIHNILSLMLAIITGGIIYTLSLALTGEIDDEINYIKNKLLKK